tara:strand:- start:1078 stop:1836 length:759 start_codon:yes stop_codon:yes gene_type:complete
LKNNFTKISIIIATYNSEKTIKKCLDSCILQDYPNKEILIIDGNSSDNTLKIVQNFKSSNLSFFSDADTGIYDAWNKGVKICTGDWVCFIGSDDFWIFKSAISKLVEKINDEKINFVSGKIRVYNAANKSFFLMGNKWDYKKLSSNINIAHPGSLHKKSLIKKFGSFNSRFKIAGDHDFLIRSGEEIKSEFLNLEIIQMLDSGISNSKPILAFYESSSAIMKNKNFGMMKGINFFFKSIIKFYIRKFIWKKR